MDQPPPKKVRLIHETILLLATVIYYMYLAIHCVFYTQCEQDHLGIDQGKTHLSLCGSGR